MNRNMLNNAISLAALYHHNQFDKAGQPYILHCLKVMHYLKTDDEELMCIAVLHDILEDTDCDEMTLFTDGMSKRVVDGVKCLTKTGESPEEYLAKILSNPDAIRVKMCDLRHNMDIRRLKGVTEKDVARLDKYAKMYTILKQHLEK